MGSCDRLPRASYVLRRVPIRPGHRAPPRCSAEDRKAMAKSRPRPDCKVGTRRVHNRVTDRKSAVGYVRQGVGVLGCFVHGRIPHCCSQEAASAFTCRWGEASRRVEVEGRLDKVKSGDSKCSAGSCRNIAAGYVAVAMCERPRRALYQSHSLRMQPALPAMAGRKRTQCSAVIFGLTRHTKKRHSRGHSKGRGTDQKSIFAAVCALDYPHAGEGPRSLLELPRKGSRFHDLGESGCDVYCSDRRRGWRLNLPLL